MSTLGHELGHALHTFGHGLMHANHALHLAHKIIHVITTHGARLAGAGGVAATGVNGVTLAGAAGGSLGTFVAAHPVLGAGIAFVSAHPVGATITLAVGLYLAIKAENG